MADVTFSEVTKRYGDVPVIENLNLHIEDHEGAVSIGGELGERCLRAACEEPGCPAVRCLMANTLH